MILSPIWPMALLEELSLSVARLNLPVGSSSSLNAKFTEVSKGIYCIRIHPAPSNGADS